jgi:hypothetical protein
MLKSFQVILSLCSISGQNISVARWPPSRPKFLGQKSLPIKCYSKICLVFKIKIAAVKNSEKRDFKCGRESC